MIKKKIAAILLCCLAITGLAFSSCNKQNPSESSEPVSSAAESTNSEQSKAEESKAEESKPEEKPARREPYMKDLEKCPMELEFTDNTYIKLKYTDEAGVPMETSFIHKPWSTWNICDFVYNGMSVTGGATDWEYVYRAKSGAAWAGGNHGNEHMLSIEFRDDITGEVFDMTVGNKYETERLRVIEKTQLHTGDENVPFCNVVRDYTVVGRQISLNVDYEFITDMDFTLSYTCMFPVNKKFGLYIDFIDMDSGERTTVTTTKVGKPDYSGPMYKGHKSAVCEMYGPDYPNIRCVTEIMTPKDSCRDFTGADKTFYWDMNTTHNKLYFSKFHENAAFATIVRKGTKWHTESRWTLITDYKAEK